MRPFPFTKYRLTAPPVLSGMVLWLDAKQLSYADGAFVASWPDLSSANTPTTVTHLPIMSTSAMGGLPAVYLQNGEVTPALTTAFSSATGGTHFSVQSRVSVSNPTILSSAGVEISQGGDSWLLYSSYAYYEDSFLTSRVGPIAYNSTTSAIFLSPFTYSVESDATGTISKFNGTASATSSNAYITPTYFSVGKNNNGTNTYGYVSEVLVYNRRLTPTEITDTRAYLATKWGTP